MGRYRKNDVPRSRSSRVAKITSPVISDGIYPRTRLFQKLDDARQRSIVWLAAPAGSGKTTLVASYLKDRNLPAVWYQVDGGDRDVASFFYYLGLAGKEAAPKHRTPLPLLTSEYQGDLHTFSANFFLAFFCRLKTPAVLVLDNYQEAGDGLLHELLVAGFAALPTGVNIVILSREDSPGVFARARVSGSISTIDWNDMKLTAEESCAVLELRHKKNPLAPEVRERLYQDAQGWMAGIVLLAEFGGNFLANKTSVEQPTSRVLFDYFANEIFPKGDAQVWQFLMKTAFIPRISSPIAAALTERHDAEDILQSLRRRNLLTVQHDDGHYEYHPLFREFLAARANTAFGEEQAADLKRRSARLLAEDGEIETAVTLLQQARDWNEALRLIFANAATLLVQGRTKTLERWLSDIPEEIRAGNAWFFYWLGMCRLSFAPVIARADLEQAFALFEQQDDATPLYLAWSAIIESFTLEWNDLVSLGKWIERYPLLAVNRASPSAEAEAAGAFAYMSALFHGRADSLDLVAAFESAEQWFSRERNLDRRFARASVLAPYYFWQGEWGQMESLLQSLAPHVDSRDTGPLSKLYYYAWHAINASASGRIVESMEAITAGLTLAQATGVHLFDMLLLGYGVWGQIYVGNFVTAERFFKQMTLPSQRGQHGVYYSYIASIVLLHSGDIAGAVNQSQSGLEQAHTNELFYAQSAALVSSAYILFAAGDGDTSLERISEARDIGTRTRSKLILYYSALCEAHIRLSRNELDRATALLREAFALGKSMGNVTPAWCLRSDAARLYAFALQENIEPEYVRDVIVKTRLPPPGNFAPERWPWPIQIYTLGSFVVIKDGKPFAFSGRAQQKPMELLRALIAFGGRNVSTAKLAEAVWPGASDVVGEQSVQTTLHRLRRLVGDDCIIRQGHQLSLNSDYCWLDMWAFEQWVDEASTKITLTDRASRLFKLYPGHFLGTEDDLFVLAQRRRLHAKYLRVLLQLGDAYEANAQWFDAATLYQRAIETDPVTEELYLRLMQCYRRLQRTTEVLTTYRRCEQALKMMSRMEPSTKTKALYAEVLSAAG